MDEWKREHGLLRGRGYELAPGLSSAELSAAEERVGCRFPPDLRSFLASALPLGDGLPDWRHLDSEEMAEALGWVERAVPFDVEHNAWHNAWWWPPPWGPRPGDLPGAVAVALAYVRAAPRLIPVCGHRFLASEPCEAGNPVFSIWQMTDSIYFGRDLRDYFEREFNRSSGEWPGMGAVRQIRFWSDVVERWWRRAEPGVARDGPFDVATEH